MTDPPNVMDNAQNAPVLAIQDLTFAYDRARLSINRFSLSSRESIAVLGPSGCGKTTFMHLITGLLTPDSGSIRIHGTDITRLEEAQVDRLRGQHIGIVFQHLHLIPSIRVIDNLLLGQRLAGVPIDRAYANEILTQLGINNLSTRYPRQLSQGQAQRVAIARAVVHRPSLLIADEPTSALDDANTAEAIGLLKNLSEHNDAALIVVTHDERIRSTLNNSFDLQAMV